MGIKSNKIWLIAYVNRSYISIAEEELLKYGYKDIEIYIPTVRVLRKKFKGKEMFELIPLLFNYGFFNIPFEKACQVEYLSKLRQRISCIYGWVKDPIKTISDSPRLRLDNGNFIDALPKAAVAADDEVARMIKATETLSIYNKDDLNRIKPGQYIKLEGYPFDNMPAEVISINHRKREVKVKLLMDSIVQDVTVSFDNVFYSIYKNFDEENRDKSIDDMDNRFGENSIQHLIIKKNYGQ